MASLQSLTVRPLAGLWTRGASTTRNVRLQRVSMVAQEMRVPSQGATMKAVRGTSPSSPGTFTPPPPPSPQPQQRLRSCLKWTYSRRDHRRSTGITKKRVSFALDDTATTSTFTVDPPSEATGVISGDVGTSNTVEEQLVAAVAVADDAPETPAVQEPCGDLGSCWGSRQLGQVLSQVGADAGDLGNCWGPSVLGPALDQIRAGASEEKEAIEVETAVPSYLRATKSHSERVRVTQSPRTVEQSPLKRFRV